MSLEDYVSDERRIAVWNRRVDPASHPRFAELKVKPVTWEDLENQFHSAALRSFEMERIGPLPYKESPVKYRVVRFKEALDLYTKVYDFGRWIWPMWPFIVAENFRDVVDEIASRKLYVFDIWGYVPTGIPEALFWSEYQPPPEVHEYFLEKLGPRFLGWIMVNRMDVTLAAMPSCIARRL